MGTGSPPPRRRRADFPGADPHGDRIYTEADLAVFREQWEMAEKERSLTTQLGQITGRLDALPNQIREIAVGVFMELRLKESQQHSTRTDSAFNRSNTLIAFAMLVVAAVTMYKTLVHG